MEVYNLIVTYNRAQMLEKVLSKLLEGGYKNIIVVDNASTDHTDKVLMKFFKKFPTSEFIKTDTNLGGAGGYAMAMRHFVKIADQNSVAILHDDDSWPAFGLNELKKNISNESPILGCFPVLHPDGTLNSMNIPGKANFLNNPLLYLSMIFARKKRRPSRLEEFKDFDNFDYCSFVGFVISKSIIAEHGVVSEKFFIYSDDTTYSYLISNLVGKIKLIGEGKLTFTHDCKRSTGKSLLNGKFASYNIKNKIIFLRISSSFSPLFVFLFILQSIFIAPSKILIILRASMEGIFANKDEFGLIDV